MKCEDPCIWVPAIEIHTPQFNKVIWVLCSHFSERTTFNYLSYLMFLLFNDMFLNNIMYTTYFCILCILCILYYVYIRLCILLLLDPPFQTFLLISCYGIFRIWCSYSMLPKHRHRNTNRFTLFLFLCPI